MSKPLGAALRFALVFAALYPALMAVLSGLPLTFLVSRLEGRGPRPSDALTLFLAEAPRLLTSAYVMGGLPAALAGVAVWAVAARAGPWAYLAAVLLGALIPTVVLAGFEPLPVQIVLFGLCGAVAALICTWVARRFGRA